MITPNHDEGPSINLHPKLGLNARLTIALCPSCGAEHEGNELVLMGARNFKDTCRECGAVHYGGHDDEPCRSCGSMAFDREVMEENEKVRVSEPCPECVKLLEDGGVIFMAPKETLRLTSEMWEKAKPALSMLMRVDEMRGKAFRIPAPWWLSSPEGIRLRDPKEWHPAAMGGGQK